MAFVREVGEGCLDKTAEPVLRTYAPCLLPTWTFRMLMRQLSVLNLEYIDIEEFGGVKWRGLVKRDITDNNGG